MDAITMRMAARIWAGIDAGIDNVISLAAVDGEQEVVRTGAAIREAGWAQVPWVDGQWPPLDQVIAMTLSRSQWEFALAEARKSAPVYAELGDEDSLQLTQNAIAVMRAHLE